MANNNIIPCELFNNIMSKINKLEYELFTPSYVTLRNVKFLSSLPKSYTYQQLQLCVKNLFLAANLPCSWILNIEYGFISSTIKIYLIANHIKPYVLDGLHQHFLTTDESNVELY